MNTITVTAAQLYDSFLSELPDEEREKLYDTWQEKFDINEAAELFATICNNLMEQAKQDQDAADAYNSWSRLDKILWGIKESYISGVLTAFEIMATANRMSIDELFSREART